MPTPQRRINVPDFSSSVPHRGIPSTFTMPYRGYHLLLSPPPSAPQAPSKQHGRSHRARRRRSASALERHSAHNPLFFSPCLVPQPNPPSSYPDPLPRLYPQPSRKAHCYTCSLSQPRFSPLTNPFPLQQRNTPDGRTRRRSLQPTLSTPAPAAPSACGR
jgi:hypothetical protein